MSEEKDTGGPAFPFSFTDDQGNLRWAQGAWLRDYFAAKAMQGLFASGNLELRDTNEIIAEAAYKIADAMLEARKK